MQYGRIFSRLQRSTLVKRRPPTVAENGGAKKRLREVKKEMAAAKERLTALKAERDQLKAKIEAENKEGKSA
jgi:hypothetical protein